MSSTSYTTQSEVDRSINTLRATFRTGRTKSLKWRKWQLKQLFWMISENESRFIDAVIADLGRHKFEAFLADIVTVKTEVLDWIKNLEEWTADEYTDSGFIFGTLMKTHIRHEPLGVSFIIGTWNFPFMVVLTPLIAAIASGCCALVKPSELAHESEQLLVDLIPRYLDTSAISIVTGGAEETSYMLSQKFDQIFFTGSTGVAKHVSAAAAKYLTPTVLELGGRAPAIVTKSANVEQAAKSCAWAKFTNSGQICLNVNHVFVDPAVRSDFVARLIYWNDQFKSKGDHMGRIVNERHYDRIKSLLDKTSGDVVYGGSGDREKLKLEAAIVNGVEKGDSLLSEELFAPVLPVVVASTDEAIESMNNMPHPLGLYIFSNSKPEIEHILSHTYSGGVTINDVIMHANAPGAPFGGVGDSGHGYYHGRHGLLSFSYKRTVVQMPAWVDRLLGFRYPPFDYEGNKAKIDVGAKVPFKKGETLDDQVVSRKGTGPAWVKFGLLVGCVVYVVDAELFRGRVGLISMIGALRAATGRLISY